MVRPSKAPPRKLVTPSKAPSRKSVTPSKTPSRKSVRNNSKTNKSQKSGSINMKRKRQVKVLNEIRYLSRTWHMLIPRACFLRMVKSTVTKVSPASIGIRIQRVALEALQEACEMYMSQLFEDCQLASIHAKRVTVKVDDMRIVRRLRGRGDICGHRVIYN